MNGEFRIVNSEWGHAVGIELTIYKLWGALAFVKPRGVTGWVFNRGNRDGNL